MLDGHLLITYLVFCKAFFPCCERKVYLQNGLCSIQIYPRMQAEWIVFHPNLSSHCRQPVTPADSGATSTIVRFGPILAILARILARIAQWSTWYAQ
jgi:hypothetical protein